MNITQIARKIGRTVVRAVHDRVYHASRKASGLVVFSETKDKENVSIVFFSNDDLNIIKGAIDGTDKE